MMSHITSFNVGKELKEKMAKYPEVNWSEVVRQAIENYIEMREKNDNE